MHVCLCSAGRPWWMRMCCAFQLDRLISHTCFCGRAVFKNPTMYFSWRGLLLGAGNGLGELSYEVYFNGMVVMLEGGVFVVVNCAVGSLGD